MTLICYCCCLLYPGCVLSWTYVSGQSGNGSSGNLDCQKRPQIAEVHGASLLHCACLLLSYLLHIQISAQSCKGQKVSPVLQRSKGTCQNWLTKGSVKSQLLGHSSWVFGGCHNFVMTVLVNSIVIVWAMCVCWWQCLEQHLDVWLYCVLSWSISWSPLGWSQHGISTWLVNMYISSTGSHPALGKHTKLVHFWFHLLY